MKGATYVTVEARSALNAPLNASGGEVEFGVTITWNSEGITGSGWTWGTLNIIDHDDNAKIEQDIKSWYGQQDRVTKALFYNEFAPLGCMYL